ncbi:hypothetical protein [Tetragenococcus halophilus]|uniref:Uncharacterized protein n=1 Tax=Tetragenococcus halophilus (strain DSM 20338 / JCM 20259 / NCIMB 9735 / NBRC 12172) TaxID=945021 RepID=A0AAN1VRC1_TETHN|nr:hypothetical protein [Tetragenococcus halophilus]BAK94156.1 hypothetical protein TEH_08290 [Tetragenococcus halophilus NBRC 12172]GBD70797.1 putative uncharacterized protein [Tetragenococcus halophilus subsp. halophilus]
MGMFLFLVGILGIVGSIVWLIIGLFKRSEKKKAATLLVASVVVMIVGSFNVDSSNNEDTASANTTESTEEQTASSTEESEEESSEAEENQKAASEEFEGLTGDDSYPYASDVNVETEDDGDIDYVELVVTGDWANFNDNEKENYIGLLKTVAAEFMDEDGSLPFMQVKMANDIVARSEMLDSQNVKILD